MNVCYKCRTPCLEKEKPGFNDICEGCGSYLHCCSNCKFYDEYTRPHCGEPNADESLDPNGMNHCEYFVFRPARGTPLDDGDDPETRRMNRKPDWRNLHGNSRGGRKTGPQAESGFTSDSEERAKKARENLNKLFGK
ncbi:MAG: hypothetical protein JW909_03055 [Planctomycetes bacterium]|nr:hypothetical protein [Planctomycetota bacterium]